MGKITQNDSSGDQMKEEGPLPNVALARKKKGIKKDNQKVSQTKQSQIQSSSSSKVNPNIRVLAKKINLKKKKMSLVQKQGIFDKVQGDSGQKKMKRKDKKKHRYLIKKTLRSQIDEKLPQKKQKVQLTSMEVQALTQPKKQKFKKDKAIAQFKGLMGMNMSSIRQRLQQKINQ